MNKINWKVRFKKKSFWLAIIPAVLLLAQAVLGLFGVEFKFEGLQEQLLNIVNALFVVLAITGVLVDPTTPGVVDSRRALTYDTPGKISRNELDESETPMKW